MTQPPISPPPPKQAVELSPRYLAVVAGLVLLIVATLAFLWTRERKRRIAAEDDAMQCAAQLDKVGAAMAQIQLSSLMQRGEEKGIRPFQRQDQVPTAVTVDGARRPAFTLPADAGERFGFAPGDVVLVAQRPATSSAPATAPSAESAP
jgi:hypothetical protein